MRRGIHHKENWNFRSLAFEEFERRDLLAFDWAINVSPDGILTNDYGRTIALSSAAQVNGRETRFGIVGSPKQTLNGSSTGDVVIYPLNGSQDIGDISNGQAETQRLASLVNPPLDPGDYFGGALATDGNIAVVTAPLDDGEKGEAMSSGAAYVFELESNGTWVHAETLRPQQTQPGEFFGYSVSVSGDWIVVGAPFAKVDGQMAGAVYAYERTNGQWPAAATQRIVASNAGFGDDFGTAVTVSGNTLAVSAVREDSRGKDAGAVYVFTLNSPWTEQGILSVGSPGDCFGFSLALQDGTLVVGSFLHDNDPDTGIAYVFDTANLDFDDPQPIVLQPPNAEEGGHFGRSVAIDQDLIVIGAPKRDANGDDAGLAYVYDKTPAGDWERRVDTLFANVKSDTKNIEFGSSVAVAQNSGSGSRVAAVGIPQEGSAAFFVDTADLEISFEAISLPATQALGAEFIAGASLDFEFQVTNNGPDDSQDVVIGIPFLAGIDINVQGEGALPVDCQHIDGITNCEVGTITVGQTITRTVRGTLWSDQIGTFNRTASVSSRVTPDQIDRNDFDALGDNDMGIDVEAVSDLTPTKILAAAQQTPFIAGSGTQIEYEIIVVNNGPSDAHNVVAADMLPERVTFVRTEGCANPLSLSCELGTIEAQTDTDDTSKTFKLFATADDDAATQGSQVTGRQNTVSVDSDSKKVPNPNDTDTLETSILGNADLTITKIDRTDPAVAGRSVTYEIEVTNNGPSVARNVKVIDVLPSGLRYASDQTHPDEIVCSATVEGAECTIGEMAVGATVRFELIADISSDTLGEVENSAQVTSTTPDPNPQVPATETTEVEARSDLVISIECELHSGGICGSAGPTEVVDGAIIAGEMVIYTITVSNGPKDPDGRDVSDARDVVVDLDLPNGLTFDSTDCDDANDDTICEVGTVIAGGLTTFTVTAKVDGAARGSVSVTSEAVSSSIEIDPRTNAASIPTEISAEADLAIDVVETELTPVGQDVVRYSPINGASVRAGQDIAFSFEVSNAGLSDSLGSTLQLSGIPNDWIVARLGTSASCSANANNEFESCEVPPIAKGNASDPITVVFNVSPNQPPGAIIDLQGEVIGRDPEPVPDPTANVVTVPIQVALNQVPISSNLPARWHPLADPPTIFIPVDPRAAIDVNSPGLDPIPIPLATMFGQDLTPVLPGDYLVLSSEGSFCSNSTCDAPLKNLKAVFSKSPIVGAGGIQDEIETIFSISPTQKAFRVPVEATHLFLAADDEFRWNDNSVAPGERFGIRSNHFSLVHQIDNVNSAAALPLTASPIWEPVIHRKREDTPGAAGFACDALGDNCRDGDDLVVIDPLSRPYISVTEPIFNVDEITANNFSSAYYEFSFELPESLGEARFADVRVNVDDIAVAYLNGNIVTPRIPEACKTDSILNCLIDGVLGWPLIDELDEATEYFRPGTNTLIYGVIGDAGDDPTGLEFEGTVEFTLLPRDTNAVGGPLSLVGAGPVAVRPPRAPLPFDPLEDSTPECLQANRQARRSGSVVEKLTSAELRRTRAVLERRQRG